MKNYPCIHCGGGHDESDCPGPYENMEPDEKPESCLECGYYKGDLLCSIAGDLEPILDNFFTLSDIAEDCGEKVMRRAR